MIVGGKEVYLLTPPWDTLSLLGRSMSHWAERKGGPACTQPGRQPSGPPWTPPVGHPPPPQLEWRGHPRAPSRQPAETEQRGPHHPPPENGAPWPVGSQRLKRTDVKQRQGGSGGWQERSQIAIGSQFSVGGQSHPSPAGTAVQPIALARCKSSPSFACVDAASWHTTVSTRVDPLSLAAEIGERIEYKIWRGKKGNWCKTGSL